MKVEGPDIIQSGHMIPVLMGIENRIQPVYPGPKHLLPEIRSGINHQYKLIPCSTRIEERNRLSRSSSDMHPAHLQPITGTP